MVPADAVPGVFDMQRARSRDVELLRLEHGEDILESVLGAAKDDGATLIISTGLGMIHDFELGYFDRGNYLRKAFDEPFELLSMAGTVSSEGEPRVHIHVTVADKEHGAFGGHLLRGKVWMSNEIGLLRLDGVSTCREFDPVKRVGILNIR